jgi:NADH:ubiquinone oxidoreductase subunit
MGVLSTIFTWWKGPTLGTLLMTRLRGQEVGRDEFGNRYYVEKRGGKRRWVLYQGDIEASQVPPEWNAWLHHTVDAVPSTSSEKRSWEKPHQANQTGTVAAYHPPGSLEGAGKRAPATGDYEAWRPE